MNCNQGEIRKTLVDHLSTIFPHDDVSSAEFVRIGGMSNKNYKVTLNGSVYVLRVPGNGSDGMVDRSNEEFNASSLKVYPNPVNGILNVSNIANINDIEVFNLLGQKVSSVKANATDAQVDMSALTQGTYIVRITTADSVETVKVVKQ